MKPCDESLYKHGTMVAMINGPRSTTIDPWVIGIAQATGQPVDWHMAGGRAIVLATGDLPAVRRALNDGRPALVAAYMAAPDNWSKNPTPENVQMIIYGDDGLTWRDVVAHVDADADGNLVLRDPVIESLSRIGQG